jgi:CHAD domain-containing protein
MGYCFKDHETVSNGIKRITLEQLDKAVEQTKPEIKNRDEAIHDARVTFKKLRALLRLARAKSNGDIFRHENACYREAGRRLSQVRDTTAMIEALDELTKRYADQLAPDAFAELRKPFIRTRRKQQSDQSEAVANVARVTDWPIDEHGFSAFRQGLKHVYKNGRTSMAQTGEGSLVSGATAQSYLAGDAEKSGR